MRSSLLAESVELFVDFRLTHDLVPLIDVAEMIANTLHSPIEGEGRREKAQRLQAKQTWEEKIEAAAIAGELPVLDPVILTRVNPAKAWLGNACVTRADLMAWLKSCGLEAVANRLTAAKDDAVATRVDVAAVRPVPRRKSQDQEILQTLRSLELDQTSVPKGRGGKPGVKSAVWAILESKPGWTKDVFKKAWQRFLDSRKSVDAR
jgi:hypothetical protein